MSIEELLKSELNIQIVVSLADLKKLFNEWQLEFYEELKKSEQETYLTTEEVSKMLNCNPSTLWRWDRNGDLPKVKWLGKTRYRLSDVKRFMEGI